MSPVTDRPAYFIGYALCLGLVSLGTLYAVGRRPNSRRWAVGSGLLGIALIYILSSLESRTVRLLGGYETTLIGVVHGWFRLGAAVAFGTFLLLRGARDTPAVTRRSHAQNT